MLKITALTLSLICTISVSASPALAAAKNVCKVKTADVGTIVGHGSTPDAAFEDAATQCFDRHEDKQRLHQGTGFDEDSGVAAIDLCANIKCG